VCGPRERSAPDHILTTDSRELVGTSRDGPRRRLRLRPPFARADINLFTDDSPICAIARQADGSILLCSHQEQPRLADYLTEWDIIEHRHWNPAFNLIGTTLLDCEHAPDLYLVGDHNICGLEDAYLTGLYAANQIINRHHADGFDRSVNRADQVLR